MWRTDSTAWFMKTINVPRLNDWDNFKYAFGFTAKGSDCMIVYGNTEEEARQLYKDSSHYKGGNIKTWISAEVCYPKQEVKEV